MYHLVFAYALDGHIVIYHAGLAPPASAGLLPRQLYTFRRIA